MASEVEIKVEEMEGVSSQSIRKRKVYKKAPDAPKRFKSAYICFVMHKMEEVKQFLPQDAKVKFINLNYFSTYFTLNTELIIWK
jgi:hypothetical protein